MNIGIIGAGNVGLITGACFADVGNNVFCYDIDLEKVKNLNKGIVDIYEVGLDSLVNKNLNSSLFFENNISRIMSKCDIVFLTVGTPMSDSGETNMDYIYKASDLIGDNINDRKIIITKSTVPVGQTHEIQKRIQRKINNRKVNVEFEIANNPEFLKEGKGISDFMSPDRVIVGIDNDNLKNVFESLYRPFSVNHEKLIFMDVLSSELTKYTSNAMLATKISFMNEISILAEKAGADINNVRKGIGSDQRIGYSYIYPSVGYGGSCFKKDLNSMIDFSDKLGHSLEIIRAVEKVNLNQRDYFLNKIIDEFKNKISGRKFAVWGLSFKPGTNDVRESVSIYLISKILSLSGKLNLYDPKANNNIKNLFYEADSLNYFDDKYKATESADALILLTEWPEFRSPDFNLLKNNLNNPIIFDGRNQFNKNDMRKRGFKYFQIGVPVI
tara:strand:+ start:555 stop:1880 length:1326 start_codon:yes stop_codon:yes gene_type:complete